MNGELDGNYMNHYAEFRIAVRDGGTRAIVADHMGIRLETFDCPHKALRWCDRNTLTVSPLTPAWFDPPGPDDTCIFPNLTREELEQLRQDEQAITLAGEGVEVVDVQPEQLRKAITGVNYKRIIDLYTYLSGLPTIALSERLGWLDRAG